MNLKRSFLKRKIRFQKWKDRMFFYFNSDLFLNRFQQKLLNINALLPEIKLDPKSLTFYENESIPLLAWGLRINSDGKAIVNYGKKVHCFEKGIVEGVWDGDFSLFGFNDSSHFFGSGISVKNDEIMISCPSHFYEGIYLLYDKRTGYSYFSNSLNYVSVHDKNAQSLKGRGLGDK